jgi:zinc/manganese transport system substrate-binding protein
MPVLVRGLLRLAAALLLWTAPGARAAEPLAIVAAENVYGDVARQIAGPDARIISILNNPAQDPHLFEASPSVARALAGADIVICGGADYDPWMQPLLATGGRPERRVITVAALMHRQAGDNPHLWYDPSTMPVFARALADTLATADPAHADAYRQRRDAFLASLAPLEHKIAALRARYAGTPVTATEPVFGPLAAALGLAMRNEDFQRATMNDTEPSASDTAAFEQDLRQHRVRALLYNSQATSSTAHRLLGIAAAAHVPAIPVTETEPPGQTYQRWMLGELDALDKALAGTAP